MKPPVFAYHRAGTLEEACSLLASSGEDAKVLAGGQTLIPMMNFRLARPKALVDISAVAEANLVSTEPSGVRVRATTVQRFVERFPLVRARLPVLVEAIRHVAHIQIRNKGTIGGSIANADPASELPAMTLALDGELELRSQAGTRLIAAEDFFISYMTTAIASGELLSSVLFRAPPAGTGWAFREVARRSGDFALAGSVALITLDADGTCTRARLVLFGVAPTPVRAKEAESLLVGRKYSAELAAEAAQQVQTSIDPETDVHVTAEYRRTAATVLSRRVIDEAFRRARGGSDP